MEPFGLLNLLKSLLPQTENPASEGAESTPPERTENTGENGQNSPEVAARPPSQAENPPKNSQSQNAFLDFVNRHEERKKNMKR